jgi:putative transposase
VARAPEKWIDLVGPNGLCQLTKRVLETALEAEMSEHLGSDKHGAGGSLPGSRRSSR